MIDDDSDNSQEKMRLFTMEKDFEGGKWIGEEFYFQRDKGRTQNSMNHYMVLS
jgi:hypothetical protein